MPVRLDATTANLESPAAVAEQVPHADTLAPGTAVVVGAVAVKKRGTLGRLLGDGHVKVSRAARCTALLAQGYVGITAEGDDVWAATSAATTDESSKEA